jgi:hypothetical protein
MLPSEAAGDGEGTVDPRLAHGRPGLWRRRTLQHEGCIAMLVVSIILEAAVAIIAVLAARKGKPYLYGLAFTFGAYVLYDLVLAVPARHCHRADRGVGTLSEIAE